MRSKLTRSVKIVARITHREHAQLCARADRERRSLSSLVALIVSEAMRNEDTPAVHPPRSEQAQ